MKEEIQVENEKNEIEDKNKEKKGNNLFLITVITAILIFILYVFISQFIFFKNSNDVNSSLIVSEHRPS